MVAAASRGVDISNLTDAWNAKILPNAMRPAGAFVIEGSLTDQQFNRMKDLVNEEFSGSENAGKPLLMEGGLKFTPFSFTQKELDWLQGDKINSRKICSVFGVAPELIGDSEAKTYSNYGEARRSLYTDIVLPMMSFIVDEWNAWLVPMYGDDLVLKLDTEAIEALQEDRAQKFAYLTACDFLTVNEKRLAMGYGEYGPEADVILVPLGRIPLEQQVAEPEPIPEPLQDAQDEAQGDDDNEDDETPVEDRDKAARGRVERKSYWTAPERKEKYWRSFETRINNRERTFEWLAKKYLEQQAREVKRKASVAGSLRDLSADDLMDIEVEAKRYFKAFKPWYIDAFVRAGNAGMRAAKGDLFDDAEFKDAAGKFNYLKDHEKIIHDLIYKSGTKVTETTINSIVDMLNAAIESDMTVDEFASHLYEQLKDFTPWKARLWARTESAKIDNWGNLEGYRQTEFVNRKGWMCSFVAESRDAHMMADGQEVALDEDFLIGGTAMSHPGDPKGGAENTCNCLCSIYPVVSVEG